LNNDFALTPDHGPPRILRFVEPDALPADNVLCMLDKETNVLTINMGLYERLSKTEQHQVQRTHAAMLVFEAFSRAA
jgi:hypothetical protein